LGVIFWFFGPAIQSWVKEYIGWIAVGFFVCLVGGFWAVKHLGGRAAKSGENS
jgi:hypothetical protein